MRNYYYLGLLAARIFVRFSMLKACLSIVTVCLAMISLRGKSESAMTCLQLHRFDNSFKIQSFVHLYRFMFDWDDNSDEFTAATATKTYIYINQAKHGLDLTGSKTTRLNPFLPITRQKRFGLANSKHVLTQSIPRKMNYTGHRVFHWKSDRFVKYAVFELYILNQRKRIID